jgi:hypothetical protein
VAAIFYTDRGAAVRIGPASRALAQAALVALEAPSILATQPWSWRIDDDRAELYADRGRQLPNGDPDGRLLTISCGAALHHARIALAAEGVGVEVVRFPDPADPDLLAVVRYIGRIDQEPRAQRLRRAIAVRRSDQRPFADEPIPDQEVQLLRAAAEEVGARFVPLEARELPEASDRHAGHAVIATTGNGPVDWLIAGEALSAVLLNATAEGLATSSVSDLTAIVPSALSQPMPAGAGYPAAVVRYGVAGRVGAPPRPPHRSGAETVHLIVHPAQPELRP